MKLIDAWIALTFRTNGTVVPCQTVRIAGDGELRWVDTNTVAAFSLPMLFGEITLIPRDSLPGVDVRARVR